MDVNRSDIVKLVLMTPMLFVGYVMGLPFGLVLAVVAFVVIEDVLRGA